MEITIHRMSIRWSKLGLVMFVLRLLSVQVVTFALLGIT